jgi:cyclase
MSRNRLTGRFGLELSATLLMTAGIALGGLPAAADNSDGAGPPLPAQQPHAGGSVDVLPVVPGIYMLTVGGVNVAVQTGKDGTVVVDSGPAADSAALLAAINRITNQAPIFFVVDTSADAELIGGSGHLARAGHSLALLDHFTRIDRDVAVIAGHIALPLADEGSGAAIIARQAVPLQMTNQYGGNVDAASLPGETFTRSEYNFMFNGDPIAVISVPAAHSDADSVVRFEREDVVVTGAVFDETRFPVIDVAHGGSVQGEIDALNRLANTLVFEPVPLLTDTGGTLVIPVRGPLSEDEDLIAYRDMVATIRDRIRYYIAAGRNLEQIQAADPAQGYESRYGSDTGSWTTADFVEAVYRSLIAERKARRAGKS